MQISKLERSNPIRREKIQKSYLGFLKKSKKVTKPIYEEKEMHDKAKKEGYFFYYRAH